MDFYSDLFPNKSRRDLLLYGTVLIPPTIVAIADPAIFRGALDLAGNFLLLDSHKTLKFRRKSSLCL